MASRRRCSSEREGALRLARNRIRPGSTGPTGWPTASASGATQSRESAVATRHTPPQNHVREFPGLVRLVGHSAVTESVSRRRSWNMTCMSPSALMSPTGRTGRSRSPAVHWLVFPPMSCSIGRSRGRSPGRTERRRSRASGRPTSSPRPWTCRRRPPLFECASMPFSCRRGRRRGRRRSRRRACRRRWVARSGRR